MQRAISYWRTTGWRTHAAWSGPALRKLDPKLAPITTGLGVLGMPGFTAYAGLNVIGKPRPGETVVVAAASGPVGSLVGQLAKMAGARAVGIAGGADKCRYVLEELRFDAAIDHRAPDFAEQLAAACPKGIDVYFENVGGAVWQAVLPLLNTFARVPVCGLIAQYSGAAPASGPNLLPATMRAILTKKPDAARIHQLRIRRASIPGFPARRSPPASPTAASVIARTSPKDWRTRPPPSWACCRATISARRWSASRADRAR